MSIQTFRIPWGRWGKGNGRSPMWRRRPPSLPLWTACGTYLVAYLLLISLVVPSSQQKGPNPSSQSSNPRLIFANRRDICILEYTTTGNRARGHVLPIVEDLVEAAAIDIHYKLGLVCWSDIETEKIQCSSFNYTITSQYSNKYPSLPTENRNTVTIVSDALPSPEDLVCDFVTSKLYWSDSDTNRIEVVSMFAPYHRKVLIWEDIDQPRALALAPHLGLMFWTDWGEYPKIEKAGMDGKSRRTIVERDIFWPNGIALDLERQHLFWVDAKLLYVARVDFDGSSRVQLNKGTPQHPFALAYYNDFLFWSDWGTNAIRLIRSNGSNSKNIQIKSALTPMGIAVLEEQKIPVPQWAASLGKDVASPCDKAACSHLCLLSPEAPYYTCACPIGIKLLNGSTTQCSKEMINFLLVARGSNDIRRISLDTDDYTDVILPLSGIKHVLAVDYHVDSGFIFWTDDEAGRIRKAKLDGTHQQDVVKEEIVHPDGLAVDWVSNNLYWTDAGTDRIEVSRLDGSNRKILISRGLQEPRAIAVDPGRGFLFWTDWGKKAKLERTYLDGSDREVIVNVDIYWPNGIALDMEEQKIYWSDAKTDKIEMINYDGSQRKELLGEELPHIFGLTLLGDYIYWTDWQRRTLERVHKKTGLERMTIKDPFNDPMGLKGVNIQDKAYKIVNPCSSMNGGCQHLCLYNPSGSLCACASGYELASDNRTCVVPDAFLVYSRDGDLHRISLNRTNSSNIDDVIPVSKVKAASALDFDTMESRIYWADTKVKAISRAYMNGSETERIIEHGLMHPEGIAVDWLSRNIYWSDLMRNRIEVARLNGAHRRAILWNDVDSPKSLAVHPAKGWLYFALWRPSNPTIEIAALDGSRRSTFIGRGIGRVNGLTIDLEESFLYWTDIDAFVIERASLDDPDATRQIIQQGRAIKPFSLAQYQDYIYWSDMGSQSIRRSNKSMNAKDQNPLTLASSKAMNVFDMAIYHKLKQVGWNPCSQANCSHLCFSIPLDRRDSRDRVSDGSHTTAQCGCPTHYSLSEDGTHCVPPQQFLLFSAGSTISRLIFDGSECPDAIMIGGQQQKQKGIGALGWDGSERSVFWIDPKSSNIKRANENGSGASYLLSEVDEMYKPFDLAYDEVRKLLFWTCETYNSINVSDSTGRGLGSVLSPISNPGLVSEHDEDQFRPRYLALNSKKSHLYFSNEGKIERIRLDGMERDLISHGGSAISGLAIDVVEGQLYWTDSGPKRIETSDLNGRMRKILVAGLDSPGSIAVMGRYVYWIEERSGVERVEKWSGDERQRVLPRIENAKYILFVNDSAPKDNDHPCISLKCSQICVNGECSCFEGFVLSSEDHRTCGYRLPCGPREFSCHRGRVGCIPLQLKCDDKPDCADGSDEFECESKKPCDFKCPCSDGLCDKPKCLQKSQLCDGKEDCFGTAWDESDATCASVITSGRHPPESMSSVLPIVIPVLILVFAFAGILWWYFLRTKGTIVSEESTDPLNPPGTNMTTLHTAETLHQFAGTNGSSSIGSSPYCELLVPHPSPATDVRSFCCHGNYAVSYYNRIEPAPPPTPCSTDVCDNSDIYAFAPPPSPHTSSPHSTIRSLGGGGAYPPPPSPNFT